MSWENSCIRGQVSVNDFEIDPLRRNKRLLRISCILHRNVQDVVAWSQISSQSQSPPGADTFWSRLFIYIHRNYFAHEHWFSLPQQTHLHLNGLCPTRLSVVDEEPIVEHGTLTELANCRTRFNVLLSSAGLIRFRGTAQHNPGECKPIVRELGSFDELHRGAGVFRSRIPHHNSHLVRAAFLERNIEN